MTTNLPTKPTHTRREKLRLVLVALIGGIALSVVVIFFAARLASPGDGTQVIFPQSGFVPEGLPVKPFVPTPNGLEENDVVIVIENYTVNDLLRDAFTGKWDKATLLEKPTLEYVVLREGRPLSIQVEAATFPIVPALQDGWSNYLTFLSLVLIGLFVFLRRPYLLSAQLLFISGNSFCAAVVLYLMQHQTSDLLRGWVFPFEVAAHILFFFLGISALLHFALVFPRRHPLLTRHPRLILWNYLGVWILVAVAFVVGLPAATTPSALLQLRLQSNNVSLLYSLLIILALFTNARRLKDETERRQLRWIAWGISVGLGAGVISILLPIALSLPLNSFSFLGGLFLLVIPISFAIAILRENLFDIDLIINRTLIYAPLTALLAIIFALTNSLLNFLLSDMAGGNSQISLVINTAVVVIAFNPLKDKLQEIVDKRFKAQPHPTKQLEAFSAQLRSQMTPLDVPRVTRSFLRTIVEGYDADGAQFDLNYHDVHLTNSFGENGVTPKQQIPLLFQKEQVGHLNLGARKRARVWEDKDVKVISEAANILVEEILASTTTLK